ncbi:DNA repair protein RecO [Candidatus Saccharibacteria bacterium]|nr:DNA repair protein RecO [Candidatus Saccharibacteria bacterium]
MSKNVDLKTDAIVLRRTNVGEADRVINLLTPGGKITVSAKSVRREKSRLAGGIEMFCLSRVGVHQSQKSGRNILTSAKMVKFYKNILGDIERLELASEILRQVSRAAEGIDDPGYFDLVRQCFEALDNKSPTNVISAWFLLNFARLKGEQVNLIADVEGERLRSDENYAWDSTEMALRRFPAGKISSNEIKAMRLMLSSSLELALRVKNIEALTPEILYIAKSLNQL